jgi:hypothetical protein
MATTYVSVDERQFGCETPQGDIGPGFATLLEAVSECSLLGLWGSRSYLVAVEDGVIRRLTGEEDAELREFAKREWQTHESNANKHPVSTLTKAEQSIFDLPPLTSTEETVLGSRYGNPQQWKRK